jgi:hypothetical protein
MTEESTTFSALDTEDEFVIIHSGAELKPEEVA